MTDLIKYEENNNPIDVDQKIKLLMLQEVRLQKVL